MDVRWTAEEKRRIATHFGARYVLVPASEMPISGVDTIAVDVAWKRAVAAHDGTCDFVRRRDHPLILSLSSGTTGEPKGPMVTHGHTLSRLYIYAFSLTFNEADRFITATPLYFGGARYMTMAYLFMGATVVIFPAPYAPEDLARAVDEQRITALFLVPTLLRRLLESPKASLPLMPGVRLLISSGSSLYPEERRRIMRELSPGFFNFYSSSEGGGISLLLRPEHPDEASLSVGQVVFGAEFQIIDENHRKLLPARSDESVIAAARRRRILPKPAGERDRVPRRLVLSGRCRPSRRRRLSLSDRARQGHDHPRRRQHLSGRDRADTDRASRGGRGGRRRLASGERGEESRGFRGCRADATEHALIAHCRASLAPYKIP